MADEFSCRGHNGQLTVKHDRVTIERKGALGFVTQGLKGSKDIPFRSITAVQFKRANPMVNGYLQIALAGSEGQGGVFQATSDENTIMFRKSQMADFEKARDLIDEGITRAHSAGASAQGPSNADEIAKLAELRSQGILSDDEFDQSKRRILGLDG